MENKDAVKQIEKKILKPLEKIQGIFFLSFFITPFIWIWGDGGLAWKIALTCFIGILICRFFTFSGKEVSSQYEDKTIKTKKVSKFQQRLNDQIGKKG